MRGGTDVGESCCENFFEELLEWHLWRWGSFRKLAWMQEKVVVVRIGLFHVGASLFGIKGVEGRVVQSIGVGFEVAVGRWAVFFQMALTETVVTEMQTLNMLYSILDGRVEILRTASDRMMLVTKKTFIHKRDL